MFQKTDLNKLLFLDIETFPEKATFDELSDMEKALFAAKIQYQCSEDQTPTSFYERAGIWAEFDRIVLRLRNEALLETDEIIYS